MALLEKQLFIKKSGIPGAGKGLFTRKPIPKGTKIVEYKGEIVKWKDVDTHDGTNGYIYYVNRNHVIDAWSNKKELARYANDAKGPFKSDGLKNNCTYNIEGIRVYIFAMRDLPAGSEILVGYGKEYWDIMQENGVFKG